MEPDSQRFISVKVFAILVGVGIILGLAYYLNWQHAATGSQSTTTELNNTAPSVFSGTITKFEQGILSVRDVEGKEHTFSIATDTQIRASDKDGKFQLADQKVLTKDAVVLVSLSAVDKPSSHLVSIDVIPSVSKTNP